LARGNDRDQGHDRELDSRTLRKVYLRLLPLLLRALALCYIDRINVSFVALTMNRDVGLSTHVYGPALDHPHLGSPHVSLFAGLH
jgi:hypothetical protein